MSDLNKTISNNYQVLTDEGIALRGLFIIDKEGIVQYVMLAYCNQKISREMLISI